MNSFFNAFEKSSLSDWKDQIIKDLKGKEHAVLEFNDSIEEIDFKAYYHQDETPKSSESPGDFPYTRGFETTDNQWSNAAFVLVEDEVKANKEALEILMKGVDMLVFKASKTPCDWNKVLNEIQLEFIETQFIVNNINDYQAIQSIHPNASFCYDHLAVKNDELFTAIVNSNKLNPKLSLEVNGFAVQRAGATTWQEIAFCLNTGHEYLLQLTEAGLSVDQAAKMIHFHVGIGSNYFNEIAKLRALRQLWSKVVKAYTPADLASYNCNITSIIGHTNKSLRDPYTNLLRQTTEAMSASNGSNAIMILPYDLYSTEGPTEISKRMAINISLILQEESYLDKVIDPTGGSYSVEYLTKAIGEKAWQAFQSIEANGGLVTQTTLETFATSVQRKQQERIEAFQTGKITGIGMNKYPDPKEKPSEWKAMAPYLGMKPLILDLESKNIQA